MADLRACMLDVDGMSWIDVASVCSLRAAALVLARAKAENRHSKATATHPPTPPAYAANRPLASLASPCQLLDRRPSSGVSPCALLTDSSSRQEEQKHQRQAANRTLTPSSTHSPATRSLTTQSCLRCPGDTAQGTEHMWTHHTTVTRRTKHSQPMQARPERASMSRRSSWRRCKHSAPCSHSQRSSNSTRNQQQTRQMRCQRSHHCCSVKSRR